MELHTRIIYTKNVDPWHNLALEEYLLDRVGEDECILYLWQNQNTVVIGKNQNAWRECRTELLEKEKGKLARRLSGGGAVFHDLGNLNFTFLMDRKHYDLSRQLSVILQAVRKVGIEAEFTGRNDLAVEGRKFSGNAFCFRKNAALHHGTILVSANMEKLTRYLQVSKEKIRSKGVQSVQARVANLTEFQPSLTIPAIHQSLIESFSTIYGGRPGLLEDTDIQERDKIEELYQKYASWEWRYGESPKFDVDMGTRFPWGEIQLGLQLENGRIKKATIYSDAMDEAFISLIAPALQGCSFHSHSMAQALRSLPAQPTQKSMTEDIANWLEQKSL